MIFTQAGLRHHRSALEWIACRANGSAAGTPGSGVSIPTQDMFLSHALSGAILAIGPSK